MADDKDEPSGQAGRPGRAERARGRPAPTIDLRATEIASPEEPAEAASPPEQGSPPPPPSPEPTPEAAPPEAAATSTPEPDVAADSGAAAADAAEPSAAGAPPPPPRAGPWPMLGAAAGGVVVLVILLVLWGILAGNEAVNRQAARIAELETAVRELAAREPPPAADPKTVAALTQRIAQLEAARSAPPSSDPNPQLEDRLSAMETRIGGLSETAAALQQRSDTALAAAESAQRRADAASAKLETVQSMRGQDAGVDRQAIAALSDRMAALERTAQALQKDLAQQQATLAEQRDTRADERAVRLAVIAETLKGAVARGERFRAELDAAKALAPDQAELAPLEAFADTGVPTTAALAQQLRPILPEMRRAAQPQDAADDGFWKRLQANAERLVRIQPVGEQPGDDAGAILARVEAKLGRGDIDGVLAELKMLPSAVRAPAQDWINTAQAREAAIAASRRFAAAHIGALAGRAD